MYKINNYGGTLYRENTPILCFKFKNNMLVHATRLVDDLLLYPFELHFPTLNDKHMRLFLENRTVSSNRQDLDEELEKTPIPKYDPELILRYNKARASDDKFWIDPDKDTSSLQGIIHPIFYGMFTGNSK